MKQNFSSTFVWMAVAFCVCLVSSNLFVPRTWQLGSLPLQLTGAVVIFPISYILNDCITEVYGYRKARMVIWMGFAMSLFVALAAQLVCLLPSPMYEENRSVADSFNMLFTMVPLTTAASLIAFVCGSTVNALVMSRMKVASAGRGFGWRAIVSTIAGEMLDSVIFFPIVFWGQMPLKGVLGIMFTQVAAKTLYELAILPLTSLIVRKLKKFEGIDTYDDISSFKHLRRSGK